MLSRPKPGESEVDLLRFQSQFLAAGAAPAVQLVKNGRRGADANLDQPRLQDQQDVVMLGSEWLCVCVRLRRRGYNIRVSFPFLLWLDSTHNYFMHWIASVAAAPFYIGRN